MCPASLRWSSLLLLGACLSLPLAACGEKEDEDDEGDTNGGLGVDRDGDGYAEDVDCDETRAYINPGMTELCNSVDDDCDGSVDEDVTTRFYGDDDMDGYGDDEDFADLCNQQPGQVTQGGDCRDDDPAVNPTVGEVCDSVDNNCDGEVDEGLLEELFVDDDGDGYGRTETGFVTCPVAGRVNQGGDCDDADIALYPDAPEICGDGMVNSCSGTPTSAAAECAGDLNGKGVMLDRGWAFTGQSAGDLVGYDVGYAGDVDGDGDGELLIGAPLDAGEAGVAYLVTAETAEGQVSARAMAQVTGLTAGDFTGTRVEGAGDHDQDGYADILLGNYFTTVKDGGEGIAYLVQGPITGDLSLADADAALVGEGANASVGYALSHADVNGDGWSDLLIGANQDATAATGGGAAFVLYGPATGAQATSEADVILAAETAGGFAGSAVAGGDYNGDGVGDIAVSAPYVSDLDGVPYGGVIRLAYGPLTGGSGSLEDWTDAALYGLGYQDFMGTSMDSGDIDGDGKDDLLAASIESSSYAGSVSVLYGDTALAASQEMDDVAGAEVTPLGAAQFVESFFVSAIGDRDGDGREDFAIGAPYASFTEDFSGAAYVFQGPVSGSLDISSASLRIWGSAAKAGAGLSVSGAGDFDGDGAGDVLVGAPNWGSGAAVVVSFAGDGAY